MKVKALISFSDSHHGTHAAGEEFDLPDGADWLRAGLVEVVAEPEAEPEQAAPKPSRKKAKGG